MKRKTNHKQRANKIMNQSWYKKVKDLVSNEDEDIELIPVPKEEKRKILSRIDCKEINTFNTKNN